MDKIQICLFSRNINILHKKYSANKPKEQWHIKNIKYYLNIIKLKFRKTY